MQRSDEKSGRPHEAEQRRPAGIVHAQVYSTSPCPTATVPDRRRLQMSCAPASI
jgi:hypothetical protein